MPPILRTNKPLAITMWDFSWLERRWPGAGYDDWDRALDELQERGYDAVRIDAYPHLLAADPEKTWRLKPQWTIHDWGACGLVDVQVQPHLNQFIAKCRDRGIAVGLSTWFREDLGNQRMLVATPDLHAKIWIETLRSIEKDGLLDAVVYVDLCNEWPWWGPFLGEDPERVDWRASHSLEWMRRSIGVLQEAYPQMPFCYSLSSHLFDDNSAIDLSFMGLLEPHVWMSKDTSFCRQIGFKWNSFDFEEYRPVIEFAERLYRTDERHWQRCLAGLIGHLADWSRTSGRPLVTTECWAIVNYRDWPLLDWGWVKDLCAFGVHEAVKTGCWTGIATSNFCGPQFVGMWRDVEWHQKLTNLIRA
jgi:hypothetical protein